MADTDLETQVFTVRGMTCAHCSAAVTDEVAKLAGVSGVAVDLAAGMLTVHGTAIDVLLVNAAVVEAGYEIAP